MAKKIYEETDIQAIANAIRSKNDLTDLYKVSQMDNAILALRMAKDVLPQDTASGTVASFPDGSDGYPVVELIANIDYNSEGVSACNIGDCNNNFVQLWTIDNSFNGDVEFNQLSQPIDSETIVKGVTVTPNSDGSVTLNNTSTSAGPLDSFKNVTVVSGHKYLIAPYGLISGLTVYSSIGGNRTYSTSVIINATESGLFPCTLRTDENVSYSNNKVWLNVHDLTQMFGSTIADYIYNLETQTAGAGVAFFKALYPNDYYPYDAGTIKLVGDTLANIDFGQTVYGGYLNVTTGVLTSTKAADGSDLPEPVEIQRDPAQVNTILGDNNIFADTGDVEVTYRADVDLYIQKKINEAT